MLDDRNPRIEKLRSHVLGLGEIGMRSAEGSLLWARGWLENRSAESNLLRRGLSKSHLLVHSTPVIDEGELLVGKPCYRILTPEEQAELDGFVRSAEPAMASLDGQASHMTVDYEKLLRIGIVGIQKEIDGCLERLDPQDPADLPKEQFYRACLATLSAVVTYAGRYAAEAEAQADRCADALRQVELCRIAETCRRVPEHPVETFEQALQSVHFVTFCLEGLYQYGRPDRYLWRFYQEDLKAGRIDADRAQELIDCLCILMNEFTQKGLAVGLMVGGSDAEGRSVANPLSRMFLESIDHTRLSYPGIGLCFTPDAPEDLLELGCRLLGKGYSHPALFNDAVIRKGLLQLDLPPEEACSYIHSTCVEITPIASSAVWVASPYINLLQLLLDILSDPSPAVEADFEGLLLAWRSHLHETIVREARVQNLMQMERQNHGGDPLVSCFVNDCLARGLDVDQGGARYNWIMPSFVGLANLADSLAAVRQLVFEERRFRLEELHGILSANFTGHEALRQEILNRLPKYGNDFDPVDDLVCRITEWIVEETEKMKTFRGGRLIPSLFCWVMHERLGSHTGASPDGRLDGFPLGDGSGPAQGRERNGPTASILSSTKWEQDRFIGGIAVNLKFTKSMFHEESLPKIMTLVRTFMSRGGFELQLNVVDRETLLKARAHPDQHRDLVVRIGGYSDYFVHLSPAMQDELILRSEHGTS